MKREVVEFLENLFTNLKYLYQKIIAYPTKETSQNNSFNPLLDWDQFLPKFPTTISKWFSVHLIP